MSQIIENSEQKVINNDFKKRASINPILPLEKSTEKGGYDIYPTFPVKGDLIYTGFEGIAAFIKKHDRIIVDGYIGADWEYFQKQIENLLRSENISIEWFDIRDAWKQEEAINKMIEPYIGKGDPVFGKIYPGQLSDFFDEEKMDVFNSDCNSKQIIYGPGAYLVDDSPLIYLEIPKNEIQYRSRAGRTKNLGSHKNSKPKEQYKRFYFIDWIVLNKHKKKILSDIDLIVDVQRENEITWMNGDDFRHALAEATTNCFRLRPWFEPGVWGGQWMKNNIRGLNQDAVNYAWSFECITSENGIIFESDTRLLEVSFDFLMYQDNKAILGAPADIFNDEFPIRFDFLDTVEGQNLSLQCHPTDKYMKHHFGENFTQDETYYILDAENGAEVFLGFQEDIDPQSFRKNLEHSQESKEAVEIQEYVQKFPASKHDFFLIPGGTVHCSGKGNLVLEISSTPYIYTFKMYDWLRLDLDGNPRPINIERAFENLNFKRKGDRVEQELISSPTVINRGDDWKLIHLPTHAEHFYDVHRIDFEDSVEVETHNGFHLLSLVEGTSITVETSHRKQEIHYTETFIIPAAAESYRLVNEGNSKARVVKAFVKDDMLSS